MPHRRPRTSNIGGEQNRTEESPSIWLGLDESEADPFAILSVTGGKRQMDSLEMYPHPEKDGNGNKAVFLVGGIGRPPMETRASINRLEAGDRLFIMKDVQNRPLRPDRSLARSKENRKASESGGFSFLTLIRIYFRISRSSPRTP